MIPFFSDENAYHAWIAGIPGIFPCNEECISDSKEDLHQPWATTTEGPYYFSPFFLLLRTGPGAAARYCAIRRVMSESEADFFWYTRLSDHNGERVYAAYVWNTRTKPESLVAGDTLREARTALAAHLSIHRR
jgi:hypothetical protein